MTRALVTGAASGIGQATAWRLAAAGADVACLDMNQEGLAETMSAMDGGVAVEVDITDAEAVERAVKDAAIGLGGLDAIANVAGIGDFSGDITETPPDEWNRVLGVNLTGMYHVSRSAIPHLRAAGGGAIVNISSIMGLRSIGEIPDAAYVASKAGVIGLTRELASQWGRYGIRVNAVAPGFFASEMTAGLGDDPDKFPDFLLKRTPLGRGGRTGELDDAVLYLLGPGSSFVTGHVLSVDGGMAIR